MIYRPPNSDGVAEKYVDLLLDCIAQYATLEQTNIITGELNCPKIDWQTYRCPSDYINRLVLDFVIDTGLYQIVDFATRASNILDILLADDLQIITSVTADAPVGLSDHIMVTFKIVSSWHDMPDHQLSRRKAYI